MRKLTLVLILLSVFFGTTLYLAAQTPDGRASRSRKKLADQPKWPDGEQAQPVQDEQATARNDAELKELFRSATASVRANNLEAALIALRAAEKLDPKIFGLQMNLGYVLVRLKRLDDAASAYQKAIGLRTDSPAAHASLCSVFANSSKPIEAVDECREAIKLDPENARYRSQLARLYLADERSLEALRVLEELAAAGEPELEYLGILGDAYLENGEYIKAASAYERIAQTWPRVSLTYVRLARVYGYLDRQADAITAAHKYAELESTSAYAHLVLGEVLNDSGFFDESIAPLLKATTLDTAYGRAYLILADSYAAVGDKENTVGSLKHAYKNLPPDLVLSARLGEALTDYGRMAEAVEPLERANSLDPNNYMILTDLGLAYFESNQFDKAIAVLVKADGLKPHDKLIEMFLRVARARKDILEHFQDIVDALKQKPNDPLLRDNLASGYRYRGMLKDAEREYRENIRMWPKEYKSYSYLAIFLSDTGQTEKAVEPFQKAAEMSQHHIAYLSLASTLAKLGRLDEAVAASKRGVDIKPDSVELRLQLGDLLQRKGNRTDAQHEFQVAFELASGDPRPNFRLAWFYIRTGNKEGAMRHYSILKGIVPNEVGNLEKSLRAHFGPLR